MSSPVHDDGSGPPEESRHDDGDSSLQDRVGNDRARPQSPMLKLTLSVSPEGVVQLGVPGDLDLGQWGNEDKVENFMTTEASRFVLEPDDIQQPADPRNSKCKSPDRTPQRSRRSSVSSPAGGTPVSALRGQVCTPHNHENVPTPQGAQVVEESDIPIITYEDIPIHNDDALVMSMGVDIDNSITVSLPQQSSASIVRPLRSASTVRVVWSDPPKRSLMPWLQRPSTSTGQYESYQQGTNALPLHSHASSASLAEPKRGDVSSHHGSSSTSRRARLLMNPLAVKGLGKSLDCQSPLHFSHIASRRDRGTSSLPSQNAYRRRSRTSTPILGGRNNARFSRTGLSEQHDNVLPGESTAHRSSYLGEVGGFPGRMGSISVLARKTPHESMAGRKGGENGRERIDEAGSVEMSLAKIFQKTLPGNGAHTCKSVQIAAKRASGRRKGQRLASPQPNTVARCGGLYGFLNRYSCDFTSLSGKDVEALLPVELSSDLFSTCSPYTPFAFQKLGASPLQQDADLAVLFSPGIFNNSQPNTGLQPSDFDKYMSQYALIDSPSPLHNGDTFATVDSPASPIDHQQDAAPEMLDPAQQLMAFDMASIESNLRPLSSHLTRRLHQQRRLQSAIHTQELKLSSYVPHSS